MIIETLKTEMSATGKISLGEIQLMFTECDAVVALALQFGDVAEDKDTGLHTHAMTRLVTTRDGQKRTEVLVSLGCVETNASSRIPASEPSEVLALRRRANEITKQVAAKSRELRTLARDIDTAQEMGLLGSALAFAVNKASETRAIAEDALGAVKRLEKRMGDMARRLALSDEDSE